MPSRQTPPLREDFEAAVDKHLPAIQYIWRNTFGFELEPWQVHILRLITELDNGKLRHSSYLVSMGRQNGKTEIMAALGLWRLLSNPQALIIGIASSAQQAGIVYKRLMTAVTGLPALSRRFEATETRGIRAKQGSGTYEIKAAKFASLQGLAIDLGVVDEVHLLKMDLWTALIAGTGARDNCIVVGITTAGDDNSQLLKHLYKLGDDNTAGFGYIVWEAPEARMPESDEELILFLKAANPSLEFGRKGVSMEKVIEQVRSTPPDKAIRDRLNRFTSGSDLTFVSGEMWSRNATPIDESFPVGRSIFTIDVDTEWRYASITQTLKHEGYIYTRLVASVPQPTPELLDKLCRWLYKHSPTIYVTDSKQLGERLKSGGYPVRQLNGGDVLAASSMFYAKLAQQKIKHGNDPLLSLQLPNTIRKSVGDSFKLFRKDRSVVVDAVRATAFGVYAVETLSPIASMIL